MGAQLRFIANCIVFFDLFIIAVIIAGYGVGFYVEWVTSLPKPWRPLPFFGVPLLVAGALYIISWKCED